MDKELLYSISEYLNNNDIEILSGDFEDAVAIAKEGDFVYFDPPYAPVSSTSSFTSYTNEGFDESEQERLRDVFVDLKNKGVNVMLSNSDVKLIQDLYSDIPGIDIRVVKANRMINSNASKRGAINELIIRSSNW